MSSASPAEHAIAYTALTMYMRITMGRTKTGTWADFEAAYRQHIESERVLGLRARWLVRSTSDVDVFFTISLWETLTDMERYERSDAVRRQVLRYIAPHLNGVSTAHHCEVRRDPQLTAAELAAMFNSVKAG
jgi:heme-degrading monooxygenase HmoA